jgi:hypothetical protein
MRRIWDQNLVLTLAVKAMQGCAGWADPAQPCIVLADFDRQQDRQ